MVYRLRTDPVWGFENILGMTPWSTQRSIIESIWTNRTTLVQSCHASGKTQLAAGAALVFMLAFPNCKVLTTAPSLRQVKSVLWAKLRHMHANALIELPGEPQTQKWEINPEWFAIGFTANDPTATHGYHANEILYIEDEATGIPRENREAVKGNLTGAIPRRLSIGNPTDPDSGFAEECRRFEAAGQPGHFTISAFDTPNFTAGKIVIPGLIDPAWVEDRKVDWGEDNPMYVAKVLGRFPSESEFALIKLHWLEEARSRDFAAGSNSAAMAGGERRMAIDVAGMGQNWTKIWFRDGPNIWRLWQTRTDDSPSIVRRAAALAKELEPELITVDAVGLGGPVADYLAEEVKCRIDPFNGKETPIEVLADFETDHSRGNKAIKQPFDRYANRRAQAYWWTREHFRLGRVAFCDPGQAVDHGGDPEGAEDATAQLCRIKAWERAGDNRLLIEPKEKMQMASPDDADAVSMLFAPPPRQSQIHLGW